MAKSREIQFEETIIMESEKQQDFIDTIPPSRGPYLQNLDLDFTQERSNTRHKSWRDSLSLPIDNILPSPSPTNNKDEEWILRAAESQSVIQCNNCSKRPKSIVRDNDSKMNPINASGPSAVGQVRFHEPNPRRVERKGSAPPSLRSDIVQRPAFRIDDYDQEYAAKNTILQVDGSYDNDLVRRESRTSNLTHGGQSKSLRPPGGQSRSTQPPGAHPRPSNLIQPPVPRKYSVQKSRPYSSSSKDYLQIPHTRDSNQGHGDDENTCSCFSCTKKEGVDDVDGRGSGGGDQEVSVDLNISKSSKSSRGSRKSSFTAKTIDAFMRLTFLKILFVDILISGGDLIMDIVQGCYLIFDAENKPGFYFGIALIASCWIPAIALPPHAGLNLYKDSFRNKSSIEKLMLVILYLTIYPVIPTFTYFCLLLTPRTTSSERRRYTELQRKAHEIKSVTASIESPVQLTIILYLMFRGILPLPWNEPTSSSCIKDTIGRVACFPSIPMLSIIFSVLSIMKSMFDLNVKPILANNECTVSNMCYEGLLFLRYMPFSLANIMFRITSFSFIIVFFDYWSAIPFLVLLLANLVLFGFSFTRVRSMSTRSRSTPDEDIRMKDFESPEILDTDEELTKPALGWDKKMLAVSTPTDERPLQGWNPSVLDNQRNPYVINPYALSDERAEDTSKFHNAPSALPVGGLNNVEGTELNSNIFVMSKEDNNQSSGALISKPKIRKRTRSFKNQLSRQLSIRSEKPSIINEGNTSIFFNSFSGLFFPSCHSHIIPFSLPLKSRQLTFCVRRVMKWQNIVLRRQVLTFNSLLMLVLLVVLILVVFTSTFKYNSNVMDPFWFKVVFAVLAVQYCVTVILSFELNNPVHKLFVSCFPVVSKQDASSEPELDAQDGYGYGGGEDETDRGTSGVSQCCRRFWLTVLLTVLLVVPTLIAVVGQQFGSESQTYIFIVQNQYSYLDSKLELGILAAFPITGLTDNNIIEADISTDCSLRSSNDHIGKILLLNTSRPQCRLLWNRTDIINQTLSKVAGLIILDSEVEANWRVSSPYLSNHYSQFMDSSVPILMVRQPDWIKYQNFLSTSGNKISIVRRESLSDVESLFSCTKQKILNVGDYLGSGKNFFSNGSIVESISIKGSCSKYGRKCPSQEFERFEDLRISLECDAADLNGIDLTYRYREKDLAQPANLKLFSSGENEGFCCRSPERNSTFLEVYQDKDQQCFNSWRDVEYQTQNCEWTDWIKSKCTQRNTVMRMCAVENSCIIKEYYNTVGCSDNKVDDCLRIPDKCI